MKNAIALAYGMTHAMGLGDNTRATLITRGLAETARLGMRLGADPLTFAGLVLPHLLALSASSPFWLGMETGLRSYRCKVFDKFPRTNIPDYFPSWGEYENFIKLLIKTNCIDNAKKI